MIYSAMFPGVRLPTGDSVAAAENHNGKQMEN